MLQKDSMITNVSGCYFFRFDTPSEAISALNDFGTFKKRLSATVMLMIESLEKISKDYRHSLVVLGTLLRITPICQRKPEYRTMLQKDSMITNVSCCCFSRFDTPLEVILALNDFGLA